MDNRGASSSNRLMLARRPRMHRSHSTHHEEVVVSAPISKPRTHVSRVDPFVSTAATIRRPNTSTEDLSDPGQRITVTRIGLNTPTAPPAAEYVVHAHRNPSTDPMRKDKGKERERGERVENTRSHNRDLAHKKHVHDEGEDNASGSKDRGFAGPLAVAEFERLKKENESLKKSMKKQNKKIEEMKAQIQASKTTKREQEDQVQNLKSKIQSNDEFISTVETALQCQICMDTLYKPFVLAPCGHVYCLPCLQGWFTKAPASGDDMDIDPEELNDPEYIMSREKTCPTCRGIVTRRPAPLFVVNNIVTAFKKTKGLPLSLSVPLGAAGSSTLPPALSQRSSSPLVGDEDPWEGIFCEDGDTEEEEDMDMESDYMYGHMLGVDGGFYSDGFYSEEESYDEEDGYPMYGDEHSDEDEDEDSDEDREEYTQPHWEPPSFIRGRNRWPSNSPHLTLLRRGCTEWMISKFQMEYNHNEGLVAYLHSFHESDLDQPVSRDMPSDMMSRIFLGWNVQRYDHSLGRRMTGKEYMRFVLRMFENSPERFIVEPGRTGGTLDVRLLVRDEVSAEYDTTDSEYWA